MSAVFESLFNDPKTLDHRAIQRVLDSGRTPTIQFSQPIYSPKLLDEINGLCGELKERLQIRFYGHYSSTFDASTLALIPDVRWLSVDSLRTIENEHEIRDLKHLKQLSFGVFEYDNSNLLKELNIARLEQLSIQENRKRNFDLQHLADAKSLHTLFIQGHSQSIEVISILPKLSQLVLSSLPKTKDLSFLSDCKALRDLTLILGGRISIGEFRHNDLESLEVIWVRGLESLGSLARFPNLTRILIENQLKIQKIDFSGTPLQKIYIYNCKSLSEIEGLERLNKLSEFRTYKTKLPLEDLININWPKSLEVLALHSTNKKWNETAQKTLADRGYRDL